MVQKFVSSKGEPIVLITNERLIEAVIREKVRNMPIAGGKR